ncbi:MAG: hypothetical protein U0N18_05480, partial [Acidaminococcus intestini]
NAKCTLLTGCPVKRVHFTLELALQSLIDDEDKHHPLSDQTLCDKLNAMGIPVARRTVNKYRTKLGIPGKSARKVW